MEKSLAEEFGEDLRDMGHKVYEWDDRTWLAGAVCTIVDDHKNGVLHGGGGSAAAGVCAGLVEARIERLR